MSGSRKTRSIGSDPFRRGALHVCGSKPRALGDSMRRRRRAASAQRVAMRLASGRAARFPLRLVSRVASCLALCVALSATSIPASSDRVATLAPRDVEGLMRYFAASGAVRADFESRQDIALLVMPLHSSGRLYFEPPDRMVRETDQPGRSKVVVLGERVAIRDETGTRSFDFAVSPAAKGLVENLMVVLRGDLAELRRRFEVSYTTGQTSSGQTVPPRATLEGSTRETGESLNASRWVLALVPRERAVRALIDEIVIEGGSGRLEAMTTRESNGDSTRTEFSRVALGVVYSEQERDELFSVSEAPSSGPAAP